jgi:hypothetical protein
MGLQKFIMVGKNTSLIVPSNIMKIIKLDDHVRDAIYNYPTLYRGKDYETSRLKVLDHLFLVIGNGYEWEKEGFLSCVGRGGFHGDNTKAKGLKTLPEGFFDKELYNFYVDSTKMKELEKRLKKEKRFHYFLDKAHKKETNLIFEADEETAKDYVRNYEAETGINRRNGVPATGWTFVDKARSDHSISPYPICEYSAIKEIYNGKTNSLHIDNFELKKIQPDWLVGAIDIVKASLAYYNDKKQYDSHIYCTDRTTGKRSKHWAKYRKEQVDFLEKFLEKFDK